MQLKDAEQFLEEIRPKVEYWVQEFTGLSFKTPYIILVIGDATIFYDIKVNGDLIIIDILNNNDDPELIDALAHELTHKIRRDNGFDDYDDEFLPQRVQTEVRYKLLGGNLNA